VQLPALTKYKINAGHIGIFIQLFIVFLPSVSSVTARSLPELFPTVISGFRTVPKK